MTSHPRQPEIVDEKNTFWTVHWSSWRLRTKRKRLKTMKRKQTGNENERIKTGETDRISTKLDAVVEVEDVVAVDIFGESNVRNLSESLPQCSASFSYIFLYV
jgi:hypothetical protein